MSVRSPVQEEHGSPQRGTFPDATTAALSASPPTRQGVSSCGGCSCLGSEYDEDEDAETKRAFFVRFFRRAFPQHLVKKEGVGVSPAFLDNAEREGGQFQDARFS